MKKQKLMLSLVAMISAATLLSGCGSKEETEIKQNEIEAQAEAETTEAVYAEQDLADYPLSEETQAKLDALTTDYSKVNWLAEYEPADGIVVSEATFVHARTHYENVVIAFTNLTGNHITLSVEGYLEDVNGEIIEDVVKDGIEIWDGNTVAIAVSLSGLDSAGNIKWSNLTTEPLDREYVPYEQTTSLGKNEYDNYKIQAEYSTAENVYLDNDIQLGLVLDKDGNVLGGEYSNFYSNRVVLSYKTFGGENADAVFFGNPYYERY